MKANLIRDPEHGYLRVDPLPTKEEVDRYYKEEFYAQNKRKEKNDSGLEMMRKEREFHWRSYEDMFCLFESNGILGSDPAPTVADVGCGYGLWLEFLKEKGVEGYGVEPVQEAVDYINGTGARAYCLPIEELETPPHGQRVTCVTMLNALEHLREPADILKGFVKNWLLPGGYVLVRVPNEFNPLQTTGDALHSLDQWWVAPPAHISYFDLPSLSTLFSNCGLEVIDFSATFPLEMFLVMGDAYVGNAELGKACHNRRVQFERNLDEHGHAELRRALYRKFAEIGIGRQIIVLAKTKS
jgi:SAM-dependent methyltransferase